jgi:hypothetical protein
MITEDQTPVIEFLAAPSTHGGASVERIDTHTAMSAANHGWTAPNAPFVRIVL